MDHDSGHIIASYFLNTTVRHFRDPYKWEYSLAVGGEDLEDMINLALDMPILKICLSYTWPWTDSPSTKPFKSLA
jgi:hypothetical protein